MDQTQDVENVLGYNVTTWTISTTVDKIAHWIDSGEKRKVFICANPHSMVEAKNDAEFKQVIQEADLVTPDGAGVILASRILGGSMRGRVTGSDVFWGLSDVLNKIGGKSYFFLGSTEKTLAAIKENMARDYPHIKVAGFYSPPFKPELSEDDSQKMVRAINAVQPDVLWVGMTAPKQEKWIHQHRDQLNVKFIGAIGAVFDFYVGNVKRSHPVFQKMGLEWLPRLIQEPRRLFKRNFVSSPLFLAMVLAQRFGFKGR